MPRALCWSWGGGRYRMSKVPLTRVRDFIRRIAHFRRNFSNTIHKLSSGTLPVVFWVVALSQPGRPAIARVPILVVQPGGAPIRQLWSGNEPGITKLERGE